LFARALNSVDVGELILSGGSGSGGAAATTTTTGPAQTTTAPAETKKDGIHSTYKIINLIKQQLITSYIK